MSFDLSIKNGDIYFDPGGSVKTVSKNSKLRQDIIKIILTDIGENRFHKGYGSAVGRLIGTLGAAYIGAQTPTNLVTFGG